MDKVVDEHNKKHVSRSTQMMPNEADRTSNHDVVLPNIESIRKSDTPRDVINVGDDIRVIINDKSGKFMCPSGRTSFTRWLRRRSGYTCI